VLSAVAYNVIDAPLSMQEYLIRKTNKFQTLSVAFGEVWKTHGAT